MKRQYSLVLLVLVAICAIGAIVAQVASRTTMPRELLFDDDWYFLEGEHPEAITDDATQLPLLTDWQQIDLPHDFAALPRDRKLCNVPDSMLSVGPFAQTSPGKAATGWTLGGEGWYVKKLRVNNPAFQIDSQKHVVLYFEGAYNQTYLWVNGHEVGSNMYGYSSFSFDISPYLHRDEQGMLNTDLDNVITVRVVNQGRNSRWYAGAGIYRHVWLQVTDRLHLDRWSTFVQTTQLKDVSEDFTTAALAELSIHAQVTDTATYKEGDNRSIHYTLELLSPDGDNIVSSASGDIVSEQHIANIDQRLQIPNAHLWSCHHPVLYTLRLAVRHNDNTDQVEIPVGIRTLKFTAEEGFLLNGEPTLLRGACIHHDNGLLGARAYDRAEQRKIQLLRQAGYNAVRGSHNPMSESFMNECDRQGMLVIDEAFDMWNKTKNKQDYHLYFDSLGVHDMQALVRRDRNHPSLIMYSIGNEIPERADSLGVVIAARLRAAILDLDDSRPVTMGINSIWNKTRTARLSIEPACRSLDVAGYNYRVWNYEPEHIQAPQRVMYGSETVICEVASDWRRCEQLPWVIGNFLWTGMDYIGEAGISNCLTKDAQENVHFFMPWPWYNAWCGDIDLIGSKKPQSYYHDVVCGDYPLAINVEPSRYQLDGDSNRVTTERPDISYWGWMDEQHDWYQPGCEGDSVRVNVYSRDPRVSLFLNDSLVAEVEVCDTTYMGYAMVKYAPGRLWATSSSAKKPSPTHLLQTPGQPVALRLTPDRSVLKADGQDLCYVLIELVDAEGRKVPETGRRIHLEASPTQSLTGSGNAQPDDMESFGNSSPKLYRGEAMAIIRASKTSGNSLLNVTSDGLKAQSITIISQ